MYAKNIVKQSLQSKDISHQSYTKIDDFRMWPTKSQLQTPIKQKV